VNPTPLAPTVTVVENCGSSTLTASGFTGSLLWSTNETTTSITVTVAGPYTVTQTVNGCTSPPGTGIAAPNGASASISGTFLYYNNSFTPLNQIHVQLQQGGINVGASVVTDVNGYYTIPNICSGTYDVIATTTKTSAGSVNVTDAAQVNYWGTGTNAYPIEKVRFYAGDVITDNTLNSADAGRILGYFVTGGNPTWSPRDKWTFWPVNDMISQNPASPPSGIQIPTITVSGVPVTMNFFGLCTGDFNRSFIPDGSGLKSVSKSLSLNYGTTMFVKSDNEFDLPLYTESAINVGAVSLIMNFPSDKLEIMGVYLADQANTPVMYNVAGDELRIGWTSLSELSLKAVDKLLTLKVKLVGSLGKDETIRFALAQDPLNELADGMANVIQDVLNVDVIGAYPLGINPVSSEALSFTNYPNPFTGVTTLAYSLPVAGEVTIELRDMLGSLIKTIVNKVPQASGDYKLVQNLQDLSPGIYMVSLKLTSVGQPMTRTIKMVRNH
jgi:hypothetical protein